MADQENILNNGHFFADTVDTSKEGIEQHKKRVCLKSVFTKWQKNNGCRKGLIKLVTRLLTKHMVNTSRHLFNEPHLDMVRGLI